MKTVNRNTPFNVQTEVCHENSEHKHAICQQVEKYGVDQELHSHSGRKMIKLPLDQSCEFHKFLPFLFLLNDNLHTVEDDKEK